MFLSFLSPFISWGKRSRTWIGLGNHMILVWNRQGFHEVCCAPLSKFSRWNPQWAHYKQIDVHSEPFTTLIEVKIDVGWVGGGGEDTMWHANTVHPPVISPLRETFHWPTCLCVSLSDFATTRTCAPLVIHLSGGTGLAGSEKLIGWHWMASICPLPSLDRKQYGRGCITKLDSHSKNWILSLEAQHSWHGNLCYFWRTSSHYALMFSIPVVEKSLFSMQKTYTFTSY